MNKNYQEWEKEFQKRMNRPLSKESINGLIGKTINSGRPSVPMAEISEEDFIEALSEKDRIAYNRDKGLESWGIKD